MPALNEKDYAEFNRLLEELGPEVENMKETPRSFMSDMIAKNNEYGERVFVSPKQFDWIKKLHEEYIGDTDHGVGGGITKAHDLQGGPGNRDMDDDIPF